MTLTGRIFEEAELAARWRATLRVTDQRVVFTNGCFDLLHAGHVEYLAWARAQGDVLMLGLNSDASVRRLKGEARPFVGWHERAAILAGLRSVDAVVFFDELTPEVVIDLLRPDIHVKSAQYRLDELPERLVVERNGGTIRLAPHVAGRSTTDLAARIVARAGGAA